MTADWRPVFVLPNIRLEAAIGCDIAALAPAHDRRVATLKRTHPTFRRFLNRFADNFGEKFEPAVLILNMAAPPIFQDVMPLASFRDLVALSAVTHERALALRYPRGHHALFGEAFAIYPWMLDRCYEDFVFGITPAILGRHKLSCFKGQSSPALFRSSLGISGIDQPLLAELMTRWHRRYETEEPAWQDVALMRSLNMAYHASLLPAGTDTTFYDVGRVVSLWVSAFEILVHPGGNGHANRDKVFEMIERTSWEIPESRQLTHDIGDKSKIKRTLASWLYQKLYECRNDFLHGNPVESSNLILSKPQRTIFEYAAPLYRIALTAFLPLIYSAPMPSIFDADTSGAYIVDLIAFRRPQKVAEQALLTATQPPAERAARRARVTRPAG
ncbi:MAG: hypothetical protein U1E17_14275 [Geminicoccaceae bacterium]